MMGSFSRLAKETPVIDDGVKSLLHATAEAIKELYELVMTRHASSEGVVVRVCAFWMTGAYLDKAKFVKERVQKALEALMLRCSPNPQPSAPNPHPSAPSPPPSSLSPEPSALNPEP